MELKGTIERIEQVKKVTDKFIKREFVIVTDKDTDYPQFILLECVQDKCILLDSFSVGSEVKVSINVRGRNWTSPDGDLRTFNTLQAWRIELEGEAEAPRPVAEKIQEAKDVKVEDLPEDDLPF